jgi:predicted Zn finger-like uncharacterized protein
MILTCPACGTQYVVKDGAIPDGGRKVRCASCRHSWHQDALPLVLDEAVEPDEIPPGEEFAPPAEEPGAPENTPAYVPDHSHPEIRGDEAGYSPSFDGDGDGDADAAADYAPPPDEVPGYAPADEAAYHEEQEITAPLPERHVEADLPAAEADDDFSPFASRDPIERRRRGPLVGIVLVIVVVAAAAALFWFLAPPEWKARVGLADSRQTPLQLMMTHSDRQALASGNELLAVSGRVINPTAKAQTVPPIQAELRSKSGEVVYRWTIAPPTQTLAPGASARFNSAEVNVPAGGEELTVSLGAPGA